MGITGGAIKFFKEAFPPKSTFKVEDMPDLTGKVMIVTGGNSGIGKETVKALLSKNAKVYMACRSRQRAEEAIVDLKKQTGKEAIFLELDLASLKSVKSSAETFLRQEKQLHVLFNNGGVSRPPIETLTADGYDMQFGINVLGHHYFTKLLLATLISTSSELGAKTRIVTTSSSTHWFTDKIDFETLRDGPKRRKLSRSELYVQSKLGNLLMANEFARRYADQGILSVSVNPGCIKTNINRHMGSLVQFVFETLLHYDTPFGALTQLWAGTMPEVEVHNGEYFIPWARLGASRKELQDSRAGEELWNWLEEQVKTNQTLP